MMKKIATALEASGCVGVSTGLFLLAPWLGITAAGVLSVLFGIAVERSTKREETERAG